MPSWKSVAVTAGDSAWTPTLPTPSRPDTANWVGVPNVNGVRSERVVTVPARTVQAPLPIFRRTT